MAVPIQGSGTYVLEAAVATLVGPDDTLLVLINGAYGERMAEIASRMGRTVDVMRWEETQPVDPSEVAAKLAANPRWPNPATHTSHLHLKSSLFSR